MNKPNGAFAGDRRRQAVDGGAAPVQLASPADATLAGLGGERRSVGACRGEFTCTAVHHLAKASIPRQEIGSHYTHRGDFPDMSLRYLDPPAMHSGTRADRGLYGFRKLRKGTAITETPRLLHSSTPL